MAPPSSLEGNDPISVPIDDRIERASDWNGPTGANRCRDGSTGDEAGTVTDEREDEGIDRENRAEGGDRGESGLPATGDSTAEGDGGESSRSSPVLELVRVFLRLLR